MDSGKLKPTSQTKTSGLLWTDKKRLLLLGLPFTFTRYYLYSDRIKVHKGFLNKQYDEVRLYRVLDVSCSQTLAQRIFGLGTLHVRSKDKTLGNFDLVNIKKSTEMLTVISDTAEEERDNKHVSTREFIGADSMDSEDDE